MSGAELVIVGLVIVIAVCVWVDNRSTKRKIAHDLRRRRAEEAIAEELVRRRPDLAPSDDETPGPP